MQSLTVNVAGVVVDRQSFLDGARVFTIEGADQPATGWLLSLTFRWPVASETVDEGDIALTAPDGGELYGALTGGTAAETTDDAGDIPAGQVDLRFAISGGEGAYASASGELRVHGSLAGEGPGAGGTFEGEGVLLAVEMSVNGADALARYRSAENNPTMTPER